nr:PREDICTED: ras-like GTP-binding protein RhoL isoform X1 [Tribolium castaneum]|eukprot:XP_972208.2 PREDICTED: ras-like GTP-binding protein RhoL isoform X1 [Tribolium castaneum]
MSDFCTCFGGCWQSRSVFASCPTMKNQIRITVVGDGDTGKTCMLIVYKDRKFDERYIPTVFDVYSMTITIDRKEYTMILQDTAGQEEFDKLRQLAYKETDVFILCYAVNDANSWDNVKEKWAPEIRRCCPRAKLILAATKCDLENERILDKKSGQKLAKLIKADDFIENSAKLRWNVDETICLALTVFVNAQKTNKRENTSTCALL